MSNLDLLSAGFTAVFGNDWERGTSGSPGSLDDLIRSKYVMVPQADISDCIKLNINFVHHETFPVSVPQWYTAAQLRAVVQQKTGIHQIQLNHSGSLLIDQRLSYYGIQSNNQSVTVERFYIGGGQHPAPSVLGQWSDQLDSRYDYDLSDVTDDGQTYKRGGFVYRRPYGWKRTALKVVGKYDNDEWLGPDGIRTEESPGEWPVCYHGTNISNVGPIATGGYKPGPRALHGRGVYTSPSLEMVEKLYAQEFTHQGKSYKIAIQNRANPNRLQVIPASETSAGADYWLSQNGADVRPYGVLIREV